MKHLLTLTALLAALALPTYAQGDGEKKDPKPADEKHVQDKKDDAAAKEKEAHDKAVAEIKEGVKKDLEEAKAKNGGKELTKEQRKEILEKWEAKKAELEKSWKEKHGDHPGKGPGAKEGQGPHNPGKRADSEAMKALKAEAKKELEEAKAKNGGKELTKEQRKEIKEKFEKKIEEQKRKDAEQPKKD